MIKAGFLLLLSLELCIFMMRVNIHTFWQILRLLIAMIVASCDLLDCLD